MQSTRSEQCASLTFLQQRKLHSCRRSLIFIHMCRYSTTDNGRWYHREWQVNPGTPTHKQIETKPSEAKPSKTKHSKANPSQAKQKAKLSKAEPSKAEPSKAKNKAEQKTRREEGQKVRGPFVGLRSPLAEPTVTSAGPLSKSERPDPPRGAPNCSELKV